MKSFILILFVSITSIVVAQNSHFITADEYFVAGYYKEAIKGFQKDLKSCGKKGTCDYVNLKLATSYYELHDYVKSNSYFEAIENRTNWDEKSYISYILTLKSLGKYKEASLLLLESKINESRFSKKWLEEKTDSGISNYNLLITNIAVGQSYTGITKHKGQLITSSPSVVNGKKTEGYFLTNFNTVNDSVYKSLGLFKASKKQESFYQGNPMSYKDSELFFVQNKSDDFRYTYKNKSKKNISTNGGNLLNIFLLKDNKIDYLTKVNGSDCNNVSPFFFELNSKKILLFSSDRNSQKHSYNLFYSELEGNTGWSIPQEISGVNTIFDEVFPYYRNNQFYFSSRAYNGFGGLDVYQGELSFKGGVLSVSNIDNLGSSINSSFDDFGVYWDSDSTGFVGSNRVSENGKDRVFRFSYSNKVNLKGLVVDAREVPTEASVLIESKDKFGNWYVLDSLLITNKGDFKYTINKIDDYKFTYTASGLDTTILYYNNSDLPKDAKDQFKVILLDDVTIYGHLKDAITEKPLPGSTVKIYEMIDGERVLVAEKTVDKDGNWDFAFQRDKDYEVDIELRDYDKVTFEVSRDSDQRQFDFDKLLDLGLNPEVKEAAVIRIDNIYFDYNSADITKESYPILNNLIKFLESKPSLKIELSAHTDCVGSNRYNNKLSQKRAESCFQFLVEKGISKYRLTPVGYGEKYILNGCTEPEQCSEEENRINRRIEVKVL